MHRTKFGASSKDTTGEKQWTSLQNMQWQTHEYRKAWGYGRESSTRPSQTPCFNRGKGSDPSEGCATSPSCTPGTTTPVPRQNPGPSVGISAVEENTMSLLISAYKRDFASSSSNCRLGASSQLARWAARHIQRPPVHLGNHPTPPRREGSFGGRPAEPPASSPARDSHSRAPPGRAAPPAGQSREESRGRAPSRRSGPAQPTHLPLPGPARSPGPPAPEPVGKARPGVPRRGGGRGRENPRR